MIIKRGMSVLNQLTNKATEKLSPFKTLTTEQENLVNSITEFAAKHLKNNFPAIYTIYGDTGTGKSVVLSNLFERFQQSARQNPTSPFFKTKNYFLVNHPEILKVYREIAGPIKGLYKKDFTRPTSLINQLDKNQQNIDIAVIDEAHLLLSKADHYNNFYHDNQLVEIINRAKVVVLVFDQYQVLRMKSLWTPKRLEKITHQYPHQEYHLRHQFRMTASDQLIDWFNHFTDRYELTAIPKNSRQNYDFRIYDDAEKCVRQLLNEMMKLVFHEFYRLLDIPQLSMAVSTTLKKDNSSYPGINITILSLRGLNYLKQSMKLAQFIPVRDLI